MKIDLMKICCEYKSYTEMAEDCVKWRASVPPILNAEILQREHYLIRTPLNTKAENCKKLIWQTRVNKHFKEG
jgi:hypothetical protein